MIPKEVADISDMLEVAYDIEERLARRIAWDIYNSFDFCKCD
jgi:hypothetical protein